MTAVFVGGCGRSGTTLLGAMLGSHRLTVATPESRFKFYVYRRLLLSGLPIDGSHAWPLLRDDWGVDVWGIDLASVDVAARDVPYGQLLLRFVEMYAADVSKERATIWIDHTPNNTQYAYVLNALYPSSRLVHLVRDGRAVAASVLPLDWGPNTVRGAASWWELEVARGLAAERLFGPERSCRVYYEDLVTNPEKTLRQLCEFLSIDYDERMLDGSEFVPPAYTKAQHDLVGSPVDTSRLEAWRSSLTRRQIEVFELVAWQTMLAFGYERSTQGRIDDLTTLERVSSFLFELARARTVNRIRRRRRRRLTEEQQQR